MIKKWTDAIAHCHKTNEAWVLATLIGARGSTPRDSGTKMLVTETQTYDTLGGGRLEHMVTQRARELIKEGGNQQQLENFSLSLKTHQCCGGSVTVLFESFCNPSLNVHLFGAGHVAKALVTILGDLDVKVHWTDSRVDQFPRTLPKNTRKVVLSDIVEHVKQFKAGDIALVLTHDHAIDYDIVEQLLLKQKHHSNNQGYIGLIGSKSKSTRFKKHLKHAGFSEQQIDNLQCPVGITDIAGKQPMQVAVSIAAQLIQYQENNTSDTQAPLRWKDIKNNEKASSIDVSDQDLINAEDLL